MILPCKRLAGGRVMEVLGWNLIPITPLMYPGSGKETPDVCCGVLCILFCNNVFCLTAETLHRRQHLLCIFLLPSLRKEKENKMFEITYCDADKLQEYIRIKKAYADAVYDFTFENRFLVYHCMLCHRFTYIALDMKTGQGSEITWVHPDKAFKKHQHHKMIPQILYSIKYTGDRRSFTSALEDPYDAIESVFRMVLPSYGYAVREEQIALVKKMYLGFARKKGNDLRGRGRDRKNNGIFSGVLYGQAHQ